jgi:uncharacterized membrane protein
MQLDDNAVFCRNCGTRISPKEEPVVTSGYESGYYQVSAPEPTPWDHTAEFESNDIAEHKLLAMLIYLTGIVGIILALLARTESPWLRFHLRQGLKFLIIDALLTIIGLILCWTLIVPAACGIVEVILLIVRIISFVSVCKGRAVEPAIIRSLGFLR